MIWVAALAGFGLLVIIGGAVMAHRSNRSMIERRLGIAEAEQGAAGARERKSPLGDAFNRALTQRGVGADLATQLARADVKMTVGEFFASTVILVVSGTAIAYLLTRDPIIAAGAFLLCFLGPRIWLALRRGRRLKAFNNQLSDTINLMVNSLRAGYSVLQAMEAVSNEMGEPIATEFARVVQEQQLGLSMEQALANMLRRIPSDDLDMMITAINVQREVGGNLAEVLDSISHTIRERVRIQGEIRSLTAMSRWSGYLVSAVPFVLVVVIYLIQPEFMSVLFQERCGWVMIGVAVVGMIVGYIAIRKIVNIDV